MKKIIALILCLALCLSMFTGCAENETDVNADGKIKIVTTIFPIYDWTNNMIAGNEDDYEVSLLLDSGVDMHSYQATTADVIDIYSCDLFIYVGGDSDYWVADIIANATNPDMVVINLVDVLGDSVVFEELVEGMEETEHDHDHSEDEDDHDHDHDAEECTDECCDEDHDHEHDEDCTEDHDHDEECTDEDCDHDHDHDEECTDEDCDHDHDHDEDCTDEDCDHDHDHDEDCTDCEGEIDEHVWLSLVNAQVICEVIAETLASLDTDNATSYSANLALYISQLQALDSEYAEMVASAQRDTLLFADRFPFRYLVDDYSLNYYAAFAGCSAETEASFETVVFLAQKIDELDIEVVLTISGVTHKIAETVISITDTQDQTILSLSSMESVTAQDIENGTTYISIMQENLEILREALK